MNVDFMQLGAGVWHEGEDIIVDVKGHKFVLNQEEAVELSKMLLDVAGMVYGD